jgi:hypothetical protein
VQKTAAERERRAVVDARRKLAETDDFGWFRRRHEKLPIVRAMIALRIALAQWRAAMR